MINHDRGLRPRIRCPLSRAPVYHSAIRYHGSRAFRGEEYGFPPDLWAMGCTIVEMLTCRELFWPIGETKDRNTRDTVIRIIECLVGVDAVGSRMENGGKLRDELRQM